MASKSIKVGMRVVVRDSGRGGSNEGTVISLAHQYDEEPATYAKVRFEEWWKRDAWIYCGSLIEIDGLCNCEKRSVEG